jgi:lysophospholipase L1-like esterase
MRKLLAALLLCTALHATGLKAICLGDSHSTVEAGMGQALSKAAHQPVHYESIGVNGARIQDLLKSLTTHQPPFWPRIRNIKDPDIVFLAFGTNDAMIRPTNSYELTWEALIESVKNLYPKARIIVLGPPSSLPTKVPYLQEVAQFQLSITQLMKVQWVDRFGSEELQLDGVHLTHKAYAKLAEKVASQVTF